MADIITTTIIGLYFVLLIGIGAWGSKKVRTTEDYIVAGRSLGFWVFTILMVASICSGMTLVGVSGLVLHLVGQVSGSSFLFRSPLRSVSSSLV